MKTVYISTAILLTILNATVLSILIANKQLATKPSINIDLPEEYAISKPTDTFIGIKKNDTLFIQFKKNY